MLFKHTNCLTLQTSQKLRALHLIHVKKSCEFDQEIPQSQITDQPVAHTDGHTTTRTQPALSYSAR